MYSLIKQYRLLSIVYIFLFLLSGCAKRATQQSTSQTKTSLWKVESSTATVYLLGSIHVLKQSDYPLPVSMENAYSAVQRLYFEVHLDSAENPMAQAKILSRSFLPGDSTLADCIPDTLLKQVRDKAEELGVQSTMFNKMRPWMVGMTLALLKMQRTGIYPQYGIDFYFFKRARLDRKEASGLESVEFQASLLGHLSMLDQAEYLQYTMTDLDRIDSELGKMVTAWRNGNSELLESLLNDGFKGYPELYDLMVVKRNQKWMPKIRKALSGYMPTLFVVGAAHLVGDDGLVRLLQKEGYTVQQL